MSDNTEKEQPATQTNQQVTLKKCPKCYRNIDARAQVCGYCRTKLKKMPIWQIACIAVVGLFIIGYLTNSNKSPQLTVTQPPAGIATEEQKQSVSEVTNEAALKQSAVKEQVITESQQSQVEEVVKKVAYNVVKVVDGDTIDVSVDGTVKRIRLIGIDTPEVVDPRKPVQCFGIEASNKAKEVLTDKKVYLEADASQGELDKYDRLLRYVFLEDGSSFNRMMISEGYAHEYTYDLPYKYQSEYQEAEKQAMDAKKGLWADNACEEVTQTIIPAEPVTEPVVPVNTPAVEPEETATIYSCSVPKNCSQMSSCDEAYYYLDTCGKGSLDRDKDGVPCETICK
jgi:micrococcal nuclease